MIIWDKEDPWGPNEKDRCALCGGRLRPPVVTWHAGHTDKEGWLVSHEAFICSECCVQFSRGLSLDMERIATTKQAQRLGFHDARPTGDGVAVVHEGGNQ